MQSRIAGLAARISRARARTLLIGGGLIIGLSMAAVAGYFVISLRQAVIDDAVREMRNDALLISEQENRLLRSADAVQLNLIDHMREAGINSPADYERVMATSEANQYLKERVSGLPYISAVMLVDQRGALFNSSRSWPTIPLDESGEDFIREQLNPHAPQPYVSQPSRSLITGNWTLYLSRRFEASDGSLIGFVITAIPLEYFEQFYARLPLTGGSSYTLYRRDGVLEARYPHVDHLVGESFARTGNYRRVSAALDDGVVGLLSEMDGQERLLVPHALADFPLFISVSDTTRSIVSYWTTTARMFAAAIVLLELVLAVTIMLALRHLRGHEKLQAAEAAQARAEASLTLAEERERAAQALDNQQQRFNSALNNMLQGLLMISSTGELLVVNNRFYRLFGMPQDSLSPGMSYGEMTDRIVEIGNVSAADMRGVRETRAELVARGERTAVVFELCDGRAYNVTHQPMADGWLTTFEDVTQHRRAEERMVHLAHHDALTDLPNRVLFRSKLEESLAFARRGYTNALLCLDLDQFKAVNDTLGHPIGDALLQAVAARLTSSIREIDMVARLGGDEFAIVQSAISKPTDATAFAARLIDLIKTPFLVEGHQIIVGTSIGISLAPQDGLDPDHLLRCADMALNRAKFDGRGVYRLFHAEMDAQMQARRLLELDLRQALPAGQLELYYQPLVDLRSAVVSGFEALLRWRHPKHGLVVPAQFVPLAEEIGIIVPIGEWALREACATVASWPGNLRVAVNLSAAQFKSHTLIAAVREALHSANLAPDRLELEITETVMLQDTEATLATLHELRRLGVRIAMDDFGTGYSSLSYLRRFPFDRIKIDQSFVSDLATRQDCGAIVRAVTGLSSELGMATTGEGVETQEQLDALTAMGCTEVQGYLFSPAVPSGQIPDLLRKLRSTLGKSACLDLAAD